MPARLYLDTARLGLMSASAQQIHIDFIRFVGEEAASLYFDQFLRTGVRDWPESLRRRFPALQAWQGISQLKDDLRRPVEASAQWNVLLASRSAQLMKLAARLLFRLCRNVLVTDLSWPSYREILERVRDSAKNRLTTLPLRRTLLRDHVQQEEVVDRIVQHFLRNACDGLFLPAVDNLGIRLPIEQIVRSVEKRAELRFVVVDGAQAFGHTPLDLSKQPCDFFIAGCHKWLGAYQPLGLGFYGHPRSAAFVEQTACRLQRAGVLDDPLMRFLGDLERETPARYGETVNLAPLFSCQGALQDILCEDIASAFRHRVANADLLAPALHDEGWKPLRPADGLRSGILLLQARTRAARNTCPNVLRQVFHEAGIALSTYAQGIVRISLPAQPWRPQDAAHLARVFGSVARNLRASQISAAY